jgi:ABC-2 type transport system permease protein
VVELYARLVVARIRSDAQHRASFVLTLLSVAVMSVLELVAIAVLFRHVTGLGGWAYDEVVLLYGTAGVSFGLANVFVAGVDNTAAHLKAGTFDVLLARPVGTIVQLAADVAPHRIGRLLQASVVMGVAVSRAPLDWTPRTIASLVALVLSGAAIFGAVWVVAASLAFWTVDNRMFVNSVTYDACWLLEYPVDLFRGWLRSVVLVLPLAFVNYLPLAGLLHKPNAYGAPTWVTAASPAVAALAVLGAGLEWRWVIRRYRSAGS